MTDLIAAGVIDSVAGLVESLYFSLAHAKGIINTGAWDASVAKEEQPYRGKVIPGISYHWVEVLALLISGLLAKPKERCCQ